MTATFLRSADRISSPARTPKVETRQIDSPGPDHTAVSRRRGTLRWKLMPHVTAPPPSNRSIRNGIANSADQPSTVRLAAHVQVPSHRSSTMRPLSAILPSVCTPRRLVANEYPVRRSWKVSSRTVTESSLCRSPSRDVTAAAIFEGSGSNDRMATYSPSPLEPTMTTVRKGETAPNSGSNWTNPSVTAAEAHSCSSMTPSMTGATASLGASTILSSAPAAAVVSRPAITAAEIATR